MSSQPAPPLEPPRRDIGALAMAFCSGAAVMVIEILGTRIIGPVFGAGLFVWSALLTVTLASLALGYYGGGVLADRRPDPRALGAVLIVGGILLGFVPLSRTPVLSLCEELGPRLGSLLAASALFGPGLCVLGMFGPIAVRVGSRELEHTGQRVGAIYAVSTAGSLIGTLLTAFVLIPSFDTGHILIGVALLLTLVGALSLLRGRSAAALWLVPVPVLGLYPNALSLPPGLRELERVESPYALVEALDDEAGGLRLLRSDHSLIGAQAKIDGSAAFAFLHLLEAVRFARPEARELLQIGLGIGSLPRALARFGVVSDVVEIDPEVVRLAHKHFGFVASGREFVEDARGFLNRTTRKYDVIVHDAFTGGGTPEHLLSREVLQRVRALLRPGGVLALNFVGYERGPHAEASFAIVRTVRAVFPVVRAFRDGPAEPGPDTIKNLVLFASDRALSLAPPPAARFENETCAQLLRSFSGWEIFQTLPAGPVITDEHNPLARLSLPIAEEHFRGMRALLPREVWLR